MRDPSRLFTLYIALLTIHEEKFPDWRFGQLMSNFLGWCLNTGRCNDIFFPEDDKWLKWINEYADEFGKE